MKKTLQQPMENNIMSFVYTPPNFGYDQLKENEVISMKRKKVYNHNPQQWHQLTL